MASASDAPTQAGADWDEARYKDALATLEAVQGSVDDLRLTIHRIVQPLSASIKNNPALFRAYQQAVVGSISNVASFQTTWKGKELQSILERSKESFAANTDLSAGSQLPRHGWADKTTEANKALGGGGKSGSQTAEESSPSFARGDRARIVEAFQKAHPRIRVETKDDNRDITVKFVAGNLKLCFHILIDPEAHGRDKLKAECMGTVAPFTAISRCISSRPRANDLHELLEMINAYKTIQGTFCARCSGMMSPNGQMPLARRMKENVTASGETETVWEAIHEGCLP